MTSGVPGIVLLVLEKLDKMDKVWSNAASWCAPSYRCRSSKDEVLKTNLKDLFQGHVRLLNVVLVLAAGITGKKFGGKPNTQKMTTKKVTSRLTW